ncbi:MAG: MATE family efflux transporter [bacterium]|nr:MATE family efflux transporter [bacterium]
MTPNSPSREIRSPSVLRMAAPLVVSFWMRAVVTFVDTIFAALIGDAAVAAIGLTVPFEFLMIAIWVGMSTGLTSGLSRAMGARQGVQVEQYLSATRRIVAAVLPLFTLVGVAIWFGAHKVGLESDVASGFRIYGTVLICGSAVTAFWSILPDSLVKAHQDTRSTMWAGIWSNVINVSLNSLFLFVFHWGLFGIAFSTVLSRIGGLIYAIHRANIHERRRRDTGETPGEEPDPAPYRTILALAVPSSLTFALMALETAVVNGFLAAMKHPTETLAAYSIYYRIVLFSYQPVISFSVALLPYAARRMGQGDLAGVRRGLRETGLATLAYGICVTGPIMWFGAPWLAARLSESTLTQQYTTFALRTVPLSCVAGAPFLLSRPVFEAMNRGRPGLVMAVLRYLVLTAPLAWLGIVAAERAGQPALYGLIFGLLAAAGLASVAFSLWLRAALYGRSAQFSNA